MNFVKGTLDGQVEKVIDQAADVAKDKVTTLLGGEDKKKKKEEGVTSRTTEQANIVGDTAVASANELGQKTVEGVENVAASTGMVNPADFSHGGMEGGDGGQGY